MNVEKFINDIKNCKNIYDIMAISYLYLEPFSSNKATNVDYAHFKLLNDAINSFIDENLDKRICNINVLINDMNYIIFKHYNLSESLLYNIIHQIDDISYQYPFFTQGYKRYKKIKALNTNYELTKVYILPSMKEQTIIHEMEKSSKSKDNNGLRVRNKKKDTTSVNFGLKNFIIYKAINYYPNLTILSDNNEFFNRVMIREALTVGLVPLTNNDLFSLFDINLENNDTFSIIKPKEDKVSFLMDLFINQLSYFVDKDVDIIIFPEMYLIDEIKNDIKGIIRSSLKTNMRTTNTTIIMCGTLWKNKTNICHVYDNFGNLIYEQNKYTPFLYCNKLEDLEPTNHDINFLDILGIGRIFTLICKDIMNNDLKQIITELDGDIILNSAYSPSLDVKSYSESYSTSNNTISIFSNACASINGSDIIGYCAIPRRYDNKSSTYIKNYKCNKKLKVCANNCIPFILSIPYNDIKMNSTGTMNCAINIKRLKY